MPVHTSTVLADLNLDHVEFFVGDVDAAAASLIDAYGFALTGQAGARDGGAGGRSVSLQQGGITIVLTQGFADGHPASVFVQLHGDGVGNIAFRTADAAASFDEAVTRGAHPVAAPVELAGDNGGVAATIGGFGDVVHTFVQRRNDAPYLPPPGLTPVAAPVPDHGVHLLSIDHFALIVGAGQLAPTVEFYEDVLRFREIYGERIVVGGQAMLSKVVQSLSGGVTLTILQPDSDADPGQIDDFLKDNGGPGVQHIAFAVEDIVDTVDNLAGRGVEFLTVPAFYYESLERRLTPLRHVIGELRKHGILLDEDQDGQLFQIFTTSTHPRRTYFFEVIERLGARTFGSGNIRALYEAVERERTRRRT